jgi:hypothetical protein
MLTLTLRPERRLLVVMNERLDVPLQAQLQGVLFCLASPWMVRNSILL